MRISTEEKQKLLKKKGGMNSSDLKWCAYCGAFHSKKAFYNNNSKPDGLQVECKVVSKLRCYGCSYEEALKTFDKKEQKLFIK